MIHVLQPPAFTEFRIRTNTFKRLLVLFMLFGAGHETKAQSPIEVADFFALGKEGLTIFDEGGRPQTPKMPWIEEYQFRTETRDFDLGKQEYTFRMAPSTGRKRRALSSLYEHQESAPDFEVEESRCDALTERYEDWLTLYLIDQELAILTQLSTILQDRNAVLNRQASTLDFDWSKLIQLRESRTDLDVRKSRLRAEQERVVNHLQLSAPTFSFSGFISLASIHNQLPGEFNLASDPKLDYELETVARELALEEAESKQYFDFAQLRYRGPHTDLLEERFSIGLAFQLPNSGEKKLKIRELELEALALRKELNLKVNNDKTAYERRVAAWEIGFRNFTSISKAYQEEREEMLRIGGALKKQEGFNPLPLLEIEERSLRNELRLLVLKANLYQDYLEIRERAGELCSASQGELLTD